MEKMLLDLQTISRWCMITVVTLIYSGLVRLDQCSSNAWCIIMPHYILKLFCFFMVFKSHPHGWNKWKYIRLESLSDGINNKPKWDLRLWQHYCWRFSVLSTRLDFVKQSLILTEHGFLIVKIIYCMFRESRCSLAFTFHCCKIDG